MTAREAAIRSRNRNLQHRPTRAVSSQESGLFPAWNELSSNVRKGIIFVGVVGMVATVAAVVSGGGSSGSNLSAVSKNSGEGLNSTNTTDVDVTDVPTFAPTSSPQRRVVGWEPATPQPTPSTASQTPQPTQGDTATPTDSPSSSPTRLPTGTTGQPSEAPTTAAPTTSPSMTPTEAPSTPAPTGGTGEPSASPTTSEPTGSPSESPTNAPSTAPSVTPTEAPSSAPTASPSAVTGAPSYAPSVSPSMSPTCETFIGLSSIQLDASGVPPSGVVTVAKATGYGIAGVNKLMRFNTGMEDVKVTRVWLWLVGTSAEQGIIVQIITADEVNVTNGTSFENIQTRVNLGNETPPFTTESDTTNFNYQFMPIETTSGEVLDILEANTTFYLSVAGAENAGAEWNVKCNNNVIAPCEPDTAIPIGDFGFEGAVRNTLTNPEVFVADPVMNGFAIEASCVE